MKSIAQIIKKKSTIHSFFGQKILASQVVEMGNKVIKSLNKELVQSARVLYFRNKSLTIGCAHPTVAQEFKLHEPQILIEINKGLGARIVEKIYFISV